MPLYEFVCEKCEKDFELLVRSAHWEGKAGCPHCGSKKLTKKFSVFASQAAGTSAAPPAAACARGGGGCGCHGPHHHH
jgi:putative FmdB family regulatory protein